MTNHYVSAVDDLGRAFLLVPLSNAEGQYVKLDPADYSRLAEGRRSVSLFLSRGQVYLAHPQGRAGPKNLRVAKFVLNAGPKDRVEHLEGDRLDCRTSALRIKRKLKTAAEMNAEAARFTGRRGRRAALYGSMSAFARR